MSKKMVSIISCIILIVGSVSYLLYSREMSKRVEKTQAAYHAIVVPENESYNAEESIEFNVLSELKDRAFHMLDFNTLAELQEQYNVLDAKVKVRIAAETIAKQYSDKKAEIEAIHIIDGYNEAEAVIFDARKAEALQLVADKSFLKIIDEKIAELKQTNIDIDNRKRAEAEAEAGTQATAYYDNGDDYYDSGGSVRSPSSGSGNSEGGSTGDSGGGYSPPPSPPALPKICERTETIEKPNGTIAVVTIQYPC